MKISGNNIEGNLDPVISVPDIQMVRQLIQFLPYYALILDSSRHVICSNDQFLSDHYLTDIKELFGKKPGDIFQCENALPAGCGNSKYCNLCGIYKTFLECKNNKQTVSNKCNIIFRKNNKISSRVFIARCSFLNLSDENYFFFTLTDISHQNRARVLEKIFYHDVINTVSSLQGLSAILNNINRQPELTEYLQLLNNVTEQIGEIIISQRDLLDAENESLIVRIKEVAAKEIIQTVFRNAGFYDTSGKVNIGVMSETTDLTIKTDPVLLSRILTNMLKNAIEANASEIRLGYSSAGQTVSFFVHSNGFIPNEQQPYIFKQNYSTKEEGRGLGTYGMRLIGENYLGGKVYFTSDEQDGTIFYIDIPLDLNT